MPRLSNGGTLSLRFPAGGVVRRYGFQAQPPYTTVDALNVRPYDTLDGRERGGSRPGLVKSFTQQLAGPVQMLRPVSVVASDGSVSSVLVAVAAGSIYRSVAGSLSQVTGTVNSDAPQLQAAQLGTSLYIADYRPVRIAGSGTISSGNKLDDPSVSDWSALGINTALDMALIYNLNAPQDNAYTISSVAAGDVTLSASLTDGTCRYQIGRQVKVFDPVTGTLANLVPTYGLVPMGCPLVCTYRNRLVLAGPDHVWYMSRQGDATDWDYGAEADDAGRPVAGPSSDAGEIGEPIVALIPHSDDYLIFGCENSLWLLRGDPAYGGQIDSLSREVGVVGPSAWCKLPDASVVVLGRGGLYILPAGGGYPQPLSPDLLPRELIDVDGVGNVVSMSYDSRGRGIHVYITPKNGTAGSHWWIDWTLRNSFWPVSLPASLQPTAIAAYSTDPSGLRHVLLGGRDGYVRRYSESATTDDGTAISSFVKFGPFALAEAGSEGVLCELSAEMDGSSGGVTWSVYSGDTAEQASQSASARESGSWSSGASLTSHPRVRGAAAVVSISATTRWAMESVLGRVEAGGRQR